MQKTWKSSTLLTLVALMAGAIVLSSSTVEARPKYRVVFQKTYEKVAESNKITCFACHGKKEDGKTMDKDKRNAYVQALGKAIGKKNESMDDVIEAAMKKIETEKSTEEGKTYGDLLKAGQLPVKEE
jgi:hypothetical protein